VVLNAKRGTEAPRQCFSWGMFETCRPALGRRSGGKHGRSPLRAKQKGKFPLIAILNPGSTDTPAVVGFYAGLRELGYTEGLNIAIERRYGAWNADRFTELAADLVRLKVDVIVVVSTSPAHAAKLATGIIPIVVGGMADPVGDELIVSLSRPGGNITGTVFLGAELIAKRFGLLKDAIQSLPRRCALASGRQPG